MYKPGRKTEATGRETVVPEQQYNKDQATWDQKPVCACFVAQQYYIHFLAVCTAIDFIPFVRVSYNCYAAPTFRVGASTQAYPALCSVDRIFGDRTFILLNELFSRSLWISRHQSLSSVQEIESPLTFRAERDAKFLEIPSDLYKWEHCFGC
jgi:hypothetical protein